MSLGYVDANGKYKRGKDVPMPTGVSSQVKAWSHDNQRKRYGGDIVQPYTNEGKPNREFIEVYRGEVAANYFNQQQIDEADRKLS